MLATTLPTARSRGNWNNAIGVPLSLLNMDPASVVGVFEIGTNHPGEIASLCRLLEPSWGVLTNVGPVHLEHFGSVRAIAEEKADLLRSLPETGVAVLNRDDARFEWFRAVVPCKVLSISTRTHGEADYAASSWDARSRSAVIRERSTGAASPIETPGPGLHSLQNVMLAAAVARGHGVGWEAIRRAAREYRPLPMRWEVSEIAGLRVINDAYNANPMSMRAALRALTDEAPAARIWLVLGGMLELGVQEEEEHVRLGEVAGTGQWAGMVLVGHLGTGIAEGARRVGFDPDRIACCRESREAVTVLRRRVPPGATVFLKASRGIHLEEILKLLDRSAGVHHEDVVQPDTAKRGEDTSEVDCRCGNAGKP
jgi:UDP-N-acetylmuramoyl-tripeptide--D-alanyl-D-alanine ligase